MNKSFTLNIPISKIDEEQRVVWGIATSEMVDSQNDIVDYEASKVAFSNWLGNIREMHQPVAVGKAIDIQFDDDTKTVMIGAKISESTDGQNAWIKVKEGVLTGFSIGGSVKRVNKEVAKKDGVDVNVTRIVDYDLSETSLVDNPANPEAQFIMVKSQTSGLQRVEHEATKVELHKTHVPAWFIQFMPPMEKAQSLYDNNKEGNQMSKKQELKKGMWDASFLLDLAIELGYYINGEQYEGEDVADLTAALDTIKAAVVKELTEVTPELSTAVELAQKVSTLAKAKTAELSKATAVVGEEARDEKAEVVEPTIAGDAPVVETPAEEVTAVETPVVEEVVVEAPVVETPVEAPIETEVVETPVVENKVEEAVVETDKAVTIGDLAKFTEGLINKLGDKNTSELSKVLGEISDKVEKSMASLEGRIKNLEDQPATPKVQASYVEVEKGKEGQSLVEESDVAAMLKRRDELLADPTLGTPAERMELATQLRKAARNGAVIA